MFLNFKAYKSFKADFKILRDKIVEDDRLSPYHLGLLSALWFQSEKANFHISFQITRKESMRLSKISSIATYHKCLEELKNWGYILYYPSNHPYLGSNIIWNYNQRIYDPYVFFPEESFFLSVFISALILWSNTLA